MAIRLPRVRELLRAILLWLLLIHPAFAQGGEPAPAAKTQLSEQGKSLKPIMLDPSGGLQTNVSDLKRTDNYAAVLDNLQMLKRGIWTSKGLGHTCDQTKTTGVTIINEIYQCQVTHSTGTPLTLLVAVGHDNSTPTATAKVIWSTPSMEAGTGGCPQPSIGSSFTIDPERVACIRMFDQENILVVHESINPKIFDWYNGTLTDSGEWPLTINGTTYENPQFCEPFSGRMAYSGFRDNPGAVVLSEYGDPDDFDISGGTQLATDAGVITFTGLGNITGLKRMRLDNTSNTDEVLIVGFDHGFGMITGIDALSFSAVQLTDEFGLASNRTWAQVGNELFFLASDGLRKFSTGSGFSTLSNASVSFSVRNILQRINRQKQYKAFAISHPSTQEVLFWFPVDSATKCDHALVMNYNTMPPGTVAGGPINPIFSTRSGQEYSCGLTMLGQLTSHPGIETAIYGLYIPPGGHSSPTFAPWAIGYETDAYAGTNYDWAYVSPLIGGNTPAQSCSMRFTEILTDGTDQTFTVDAYLLTQQSNGVTNRKLAFTKDYSITSLTPTALETWTSGTTSSYPKLIRFSAPGTGRYWELRLKGTGGQMISLTGLNTVLTLGGWDQ